MSLLAPLYALAALAVGLPLLFHFIQRKPREQIVFSSTMFLGPSPPRLTRRSRLKNWLLLLLRALALILLAFAFARPYLRSQSRNEVAPAARRVLVLLDTSASMQREGVWEKAQTELFDVLGDLASLDQVAIYQYDSSVTPLIRFEDNVRMEAIGRRRFIEQALSNVKPGWQGTDLGMALVTAADTLQTLPDNQTSDAGEGRHLVVISDLQQGAQTDALRTFEWPEGLGVDLRRIDATTPGNAYALLQVPDERHPRQFRARIENSADSASEQLDLAWIVERDGQRHREDVRSLRVPPGTSQVIKLEAPTGNTRGLTLSGDRVPFDNDFYITSPPARQLQILFVDSLEREGDSSPHSFLEKVPWSSNRDSVKLISKRPEEIQSPPSVEEVPWMIASGGVSPTLAEMLERYIVAGGHLLVTLDFPVDASRNEIENGLRILTAFDELRLEESTVADYSMLARVDFDHPLLVPFAEPQFNDFTKIRFWAHREIRPNNAADVRVVASFDNRRPALLEQTRGKGTLWILASGWQPAESQLALSSKFVPIMLRMWELAVGGNPWPVRLTTGEQLTLPRGEADVEVVYADGSRESLDSSAEPLRFSMPGIHELHIEDEVIPVAVNLPLAESRTDPLEFDVLEQSGLHIHSMLTAEEHNNQTQQLKDAELEGQQKLWQWLLVISLVVLAAETALAAFQSREVAVATA